MRTFATYEEENIHYWTHRASGYSAVNREELATDQKAVWRGVIAGKIAGNHPGKRPDEIRVLDVGTGPGFFAIILAELGYQVTAVDYTASMLEEARRNAGALAGCIRFRQMNAEELTFPADSFDVVVTRNVTWNLRDPERAYGQWSRVLKPGGVLLNFDANWYRYLWDRGAEQAHARDRENLWASDVRDETAGTDVSAMEAIARQAPLSARMRPGWDLGVLRGLGLQAAADTEIWRQVWTREERINNASTPMFLVEARKCPLPQQGGGMRRYILKRLLQLIPVLLGVTFLSFAMMRLAGSDAITELYGDKGAVSQEIIDAKRAELGLDQPFLSQYFSWLGGLLTGDMGTSYVSGRDVFGTFVSKLPATLLLTALSVAATVLLSVPLGILAAVRRDRFTDYFLRFCSFIGNALPNFFVALLLMQVFSIRWRLLPVLSEGTSLRSAVLPTLTLAIAMSAKYMRQVRAAVLEELNRDYVTGARARGVREGVILRGSVLRCAMLTILTLLALSVGSLLGGTAIIESIFQWDGVGKLAVDAITMRDYPMIQAYVVWMAVIYVAVNLVTDLLYHALDPRIRLGVSRE